MSDREFSCKFCNYPPMKRLEAHRLWEKQMMIYRSLKVCTVHHLFYLCLASSTVMLVHSYHTFHASSTLFRFDTDFHACSATVQKIITEILPPSSGQTFSKDARDLLMECCVEFITLISSEANDISGKEAKKTIACEHVEKALRDLGFGDYIPDVLAVAMEHREALKVRVLPFGWNQHTY
jgi:down-regulator of transcription 1